VPPVFVDSFRIGTGSAHGVEAAARWLPGAWNLGFSYSLLFAERRAGEDVFPPRFERRHELDATVERQWGIHGLLSARLVVASGQPVTPALGMTEAFQFDPEQGSWQGGLPRSLRGDHNAARLPGYLRLDVAARRSFERRWFGREGTITPYFQVINALNTKNALVAKTHWSYPTYTPQLPLLPTFGIEWRF
ncbi:MAG: hypothetical protein ACREMA_13825, partial [Longimicrobiales bacterium]